MNQKLEELMIEISMLKDDLRDTQKLLTEKEDELKFICPHDKLDRRIVWKKDLVLPERESYIHYKCQICGWQVFTDNEYSELEEKVI